VAPGCVLQPSRGLRGGSGPVELAPGAATNCENQRFAPVVAWLRAASSSGGAGWRLAPGVILRSRHAPCDNQPIATNVSALNLLRGIAASRTSLGRCGETTPLTGLGQALRTTPTTRPRLSREARRGRCADANCGSDLLREVRYRGCVKRQRADHVSLERWGTDAVQRQ